MGTRRGYFGVMTPLPALGVFSFPGAAAGDFQSIATVSVGSGGSSVITFSSIPSTYKHLQIRMAFKMSTNDWVFARCNSDSTYTNYYTHYLEASGSAASSGNQQNSNITGMAIEYGQSNASSVFDVAVMDILDYSNANKYKTARTLRGCDNNGSGYVGVQSALWKDTSIISTLEIRSAQSFNQYSHFALYGIKG